MGSQIWPSQASCEPMSSLIWPSQASSQVTESQFWSCQSGFPQVKSQTQKFGIAKSKSNKVRPEFGQVINLSH